MRILHVHVMFPTSIPRSLPGFLLGALIALTGCASAQSSPDGTPPGERNSKPSEPRSEGQETPVTKSATSEPKVTLRFPRGPVPWLGVRLEATKASQAGVKVVQVFKGSPAERAGLQPNDVIVSLGDSPVLDPVSVARWVRSQSTENPHPVSILRDGNSRLLRVTLEGAPEFEDRLRLQLIGRPAPEIAGVATFQGEASSLQELRGQVVILEFWASYCGVCRFLAPRLDAWHRTYRPQGAEIVGITVDPPKLGLRAAQRTGMSYTLASDPQAKVTRMYLVDQIPVVVIIDRQGIVRDAMVGYSERRLRETETLISELLQDS